MKTKICGITNYVDAILCESAGADALGFVFYEKSPRFIHPETVRAITAKLHPFIIKVGVFVNSSPEYINEVVRIAGLNMAQLHGDESPVILEAISVPVIRAFRISPDFNWDILDAWRGCSFLFDAFNAKQYGGTGISTHHNLIPPARYGNAILAGGITVENIGEIIARKEKPLALDISSGLESSPGKKDATRVQNFYKILRG
ncbi:MAG: phosphoribosylanthranilate isomerase [Ignavibacteria bacterium]|nr:phosphoribosylanthranilate isomerase [Ignavibacteria bacterium]